MLDKNTILHGPKLISDKTKVKRQSTTIFLSKEKTISGDYG